MDLSALPCLLDGYSNSRLEIVIVRSLSNKPHACLLLPLPDLLRILHFFLILGSDNGNRGASPMNDWLSDPKDIGCLWVLRMSSRLHVSSCSRQARLRTPCMVLIFLLVLATSTQAGSDEHLRHGAGRPNVGGPRLECDVPPEMAKDGNLGIILSQSILSALGMDAIESRCHAVMHLNLSQPELSCAGILH